MQLIYVAKRGIPETRIRVEFLEKYCFCSSANIKYDIGKITSFSMNGKEGWLMWEKGYIIVGCLRLQLTPQQWLSILKCLIVE